METGVRKITGYPFLTDTFVRILNIAVKYHGFRMNKTWTHSRRKKKKPGLKDSIEAKRKRCCFEVRYPSLISC